MANPKYKVGEEFETIDGNIEITKIISESPILYRIVDHTMTTSPTYTIREDELDELKDMLWEKAVAETLLSNKGVQEIVENQ